MNKSKFFSTSFIYLITSLISQAINILLIPIYTKKLSIEQFGQFNIINSLQSFLSIFITLGVFSGLCRFYNEYEDKNKLKNMAISFSIIWGILCVVIGRIFNYQIALITFKGDILGTQYINYIIPNSVLICIISTYKSFYSMQYKAMKASLIEIIKIVFTLILTYYYVVFANQGIIGVLKSQFIAYIMVFLLLFIRDLKNMRFNIEINNLKKILSYGIGMIPGQISAWILTLIDRYFIKAMINLSAVAIYSMAYKIGMLIDPIYLTPFRSAFTPYKFEYYKNEEGKRKIRNLFNYFNFFGWFVILGLSLFSNIMIRVLSTSEYNESYKIVPLIAFSYFLFGLGEFYALGLHIGNKMLLNSSIGIASSIINIIMNIILIPRYGIYGAALATIISYLVANICFYFFGKKYCNLEISLIEPHKYSVIFGVLYIIYTILKNSLGNIVFEGVICAVLLILYIPINILAGFIPFEKVKYFYLEIKNKMHARTASKSNYM